MTRLPGVGKKTAERLIIEMRDRLKEVSGAMGLKLNTSEASILAGAKDEAIEALVTLGYKPVEADKMIRLVGGENLSTAELIRQALQQK